MKSIFEDAAYQEIKDRMTMLNKDCQANWGKMNVAQMVWHCQGPLNIMMQKADYNLKPNWLAKLLFKKSLYNDKPWPKGLPTAKFLKTKDVKLFKEEQEKLLDLIDEAYTQKEKTSWEPHPAFGSFTPQQWGQMQYKHLDHHLKQFGV